MKSTIQSVLFSCPLLFIYGCVGVSTQDYPKNWPEISNKQNGDCLDISGIYQPAAVYLQDEEKNCTYIAHKLSQETEATDLSCLSLADALAWSASGVHQLWDLVTPYTPIKIDQNESRIILSVVGEDGTEGKHVIYRYKNYTCTSNEISLFKSEGSHANSWNIGVGRTKQFRAFSKAEDGSLVYKESYSELGLIALPPFAGGSYTKSWARWTMINVDQYNAQDKFIYKGKTKEQIRNSIGEPQKRYICGIRYRYEKRGVHPDDLQEEYGSGANIRVETEELIIHLKVKGYESGKYLIGVDEFGGREIKIVIDQIKQISEKVMLYGEEVWEYKEENNIYGGRFLHINLETEKAYISSDNLPSSDCTLIRALN